MDTFKPTAWRFCARFILLACLAAGGALSASAQTGLPAILTGGPTGDADWSIVPNGGITEGFPGPNAECFPENEITNIGIMVDQAFLGARSNAYDQSGIWVNNQVFTSTTATVTSASMRAGPMPVSGMGVTLEYTALSDSPTLRTLVSVSNTLALAQPITLTFAVNFGSDSATQYLATSSGDALFFGNDRWAVSGSAGLPTDEVINTTALYGPVNPPAIPSFTSDQVFACPGAGDIQGILAEFQLSVPANSTRRVMILQQINATPAEALNNVGAFNAPMRPGNPLAAGLTPQQLSEIVNWRDFNSVYLPLIRK